MVSLLGCFLQGVREDGDGDDSTGDGCERDAERKRRRHIRSSTLNTARSTHYNISGHRHRLHIIRTVCSSMSHIL